MCSLGKDVLGGLHFAYREGNPTLGRANTADGMVEPLIVTNLLGPLQGCASIGKCSAGEEDVTQILISIGQFSLIMKLFECWDEGTNLRFRIIDTSKADERLHLIALIENSRNIVLFGLKPCS